MYHADLPWWDHHQGVPEFRGERWTQDKKSFSASGKGRPLDAEFAANQWGLRVVRNEMRQGISFDPAFVHWGGNSGFQALNLAVLFGCTRIILLGFDMQNTGGKKHFFGSHPGKLDRDSPYPMFIAAYEEAAPQLQAAGIEVINCTRQTALRCFDCGDIEDVLNA